MPGVPIEEHAAQVEHNCFRLASFSAHGCRAVHVPVRDEVLRHRKSCRVQIVQRSFGKRGLAVSLPAPVSVPPPEAPAAIPFLSALSQKTRIPFLSLALVLVLTAIFAAELKYGVEAPRGGTPSLRTLVALGGLSRELFLSGEGWPLFTAPLLHANPH